MVFADLAMAVGEPDRTVLAELWGLAWAGAITNDSWHPLRGGAVLRALPPPGPVRPGRVARRARPTSSLPAARGRWSLVESLVPAAPAPAERARALAETLLDRHGVLTRAAVLAEAIPGGFAAVYGELRMMEEAGRCQRGYFVEGLGGAQFAAPTAVERLRDVRDADPDAPAIVLSAIDPANPYGATLPWPDSSRRPARVPGAWLVMAAGRPALYVERGGRGLVTFDAELLEPAVAALSDLVESGRARRLAPERIDGEPIAGTEAERLLLAHGFLKGHRRLVLRA
jgi:ATP-dependent Lhr-like helicase